MPTAATFPLAVIVELECACEETGFVFDSWFSYRYIPYVQSSYNRGPQSAARGPHAALEQAQCGPQQKFWKNKIALIFLFFYVIFYDSPSCSWTFAFWQIFRDHWQPEFVRCSSDFGLHEQVFAILQNPFTCEPGIAPTDLQLELIDLQKSLGAQNSFHALNLLEFYKCLSVSAYPTVRRHAQHIGSLFGATYICEKTFYITKSNMRLRLPDDHLQAILRIATTSFEPRFIIAEESQWHSP